MADQTPCSHPPAPAAPGLRRISLISGEHRWMFRWAPGEESSLINVIAQIARDPGMPFDWFDAKALCRHVAPTVEPDAAAPLQK